MAQREKTWFKIIKISYFRIELPECFETTYLIAMPLKHKIGFYL